MYFILEGDNRAVSKVEKAIKQKTGIKYAFENTKEDWTQLVTQTKEKGDGIIINFAVAKLIKEPTQDNFLKAENVIRQSMFNCIIIYCLDNYESPYILTLNSRLEGDINLILISTILSNSLTG